ncbi:MAG: hypothetical protein M1823_002768 [Watsoniomyces obsoletus]|nr:MAG: hypothetical protein M1823_002768 [Watsoniomyces obsoletus]
MVPNCFVEFKGGGSQAAAAQNQALPVGALGARAIQALRSLEEGGTTFDNTAYIITIIGITAASAFRNSRIWATDQRDAIIARTNGKLETSPRSWLSSVEERIEVEITWGQEVVSSQAATPEGEGPQDVEQLPISSGPESPRERAASNRACGKGKLGWAAAKPRHQARATRTRRFEGKGRPGEKWKETPTRRTETVHPAFLRSKDVLLDITERLMKTMDVLDRLPSSISFMPSDASLVPRVSTWFLISMIRRYPIDGLSTFQ